MEFTGETPKTRHRMKTLGFDEIKPFIYIFRAYGTCMVWMARLWTPALGVFQESQQEDELEIKGFRQ
jgi:hypothetical protein